MEFDKSVLTLGLQFPQVSMYYMNAIVNVHGTATTEMMSLRRQENGVQLPKNTKTSTISFQNNPL